MFKIRNVAFNPKNNFDDCRKIFHDLTIEEYEKARGIKAKKIESDKSLKKELSDKK